MNKKSKPNSEFFFIPNIKMKTFYHHKNDEGKPKTKPFKLSPIHVGHPVHIFGAIFPVNVEKDS